MLTPAQTAAVDQLSIDLFRTTEEPIIIAVCAAGADAGYLKFQGAQLNDMETVAHKLLTFVASETGKARCLCPDCAAALSRIQLALAALDAAPVPEGRPS